MVVGAEVAGHSDPNNDATEHSAKADTVAGMDRESDDAVRELIHDDQDPVVFGVIDSQRKKSILQR